MTMRRIAVLAASGRELAPARASLSVVRRGCLESFRHEVGRTGAVEVHLIRTGIGPAHAREVSESAVFALAPDAVISTGYAGALGHAGIGEVILGTESLDWSRERTQAAVQADAALLQAARMAAREAGVTWAQGSIVTVERVVWRTSEKRALGEASGAVAVDMESAAIASAATSAGIPFLLARVISDRAGDDLPMDFNVWLAPRGPVRGITHIVRHPSILRSLYQMKRDTDYAAERLRRFFCALVIVLESQWLPTGSDAPVTMEAL